MSSQSEDYQRYVIDNMTELVQALRVSAVIDRLVSSHLVTLEEAHQLRQCSTEQDKARMLLYDILPHKQSAVDRFSEILKEAGQLHIVRDVMKRGGVVCADEHARNLQTVQRQQTIQEPEPNEQVPMFV